MDCDKFGTPRTRGGLQCLIHLDVHGKHLENGLDLRTMDRHIDLTEVYHSSLYGFSCYVIHSIPGLAEGPAGQGARSIYDDFSADLMMGEGDKNKPVFHPNHVLQVETEDKPENDIMKVLYYHKKGGDQPALRMQLHRKLCVYACAVYEHAAPEYLINWTDVLPRSSAATSPSFSATTTSRGRLRV